MFPVDDDTTARVANVNNEAIEVVGTFYKAQNGGQAVVDSPGNGWSFVQAVNTYENWAQPVRKTKAQNGTVRSETITRALRQVEQLQASKQPLTERAAELILAL